MLTHEHPLLKEVMPTFDFANPPTDPLELACSLAEVMIEHKGIGIAANQVGLPYRAFVMTGEELTPCFNPKIVDVSQETIYLEEGCLSRPNFFVKIKRPRRIKVRYTEPNGNTVTRVFDGMTARVFMHELDHLNGIDYTSRASKIHLEQARNKFKRDSKRKK